MLHEPAKQRIEDGGINGEGLRKLFEELAKEASAMDVEALDTVVLFTEEDDEYVNGNYVPVIHLVVSRINDDTA